MKSIFESPEVFEAYAMIDYGYTMIQQVCKQIDKETNKPRSGIQIAIYNATGYSNHKIREYNQTVIEMLELIIENKLKIDGDVSADRQMLEECKEFFENNQHQQ